MTVAAGCCGSLPQLLAKDEVSQNAYQVIESIVSLCPLLLHSDVLFAWLYAAALEHWVSRDLGHLGWEGLLNMAEVWFIKGFVRDGKDLPLICSLRDKKKRKIGWFSWWLDTARPQPEESIFVLLAFISAALHGEKQSPFVFWNIVFGVVTNCSCTIVITISLDVPMHAHFHALISCRSIVGEQICKGAFHVSPSTILYFSDCPVFLTRLPLPFSFLCFLLPSLPPPFFALLPLFASLFLFFVNKMVPWLFLKVGGSIIWKVPFRTLTMLLSNWRMWSLTSMQDWLS